MDLSLLSRPEMLLAHLGIESPGDIDIEAIAQFCQATVEYAPLDGCEARILGYGDRAIITVNSNGTNRGRQRFGVPCELIDASVRRQIVGERAARSEVPPLGSGAGDGQRRELADVPRIGITGR